MNTKKLSSVYVLNLIDILFGRDLDKNDKCNEQK